MKNYKMTIKYDGSNFYGWQRLKGHRSVQKEIEKVLKKVIYKNIEIDGSGRTDANVHAYGQVANFHSDTKIPYEKFKKILNMNLPEDIYIEKLEITTTEFHSRYDAKGKQYRYKVYNSKNKDVFKNKYYFHFPYELDIEQMRKASKLFIGTKDFRSFAAKSKEKENTIRTITELEIIKTNDEIEFLITGNGFLYKMVRTIIGNILEVGRGKITVKDIEEIFNKKNIEESKYTVPGNGLYLEKVFY